MDYVPWITPGLTPYKSDHFADFTYEEALEFTKELIHRIPERREQLEILVRSTPGFSGWSADFSVASLGPLGDWAKDHIPTRPPSQDERRLEWISPACPVPAEMLADIAGPGHVIALEGESMMADVGIYASEIVRMSDPCFAWIVDYDIGKTFIGEAHQCPAVSWRGRRKWVDYSPFISARNAIMRIIDRDKPSDTLRKSVERAINNIPMLRDKYGSTPVKDPINKKPRRPKLS